MKRFYEASDRYLQSRGWKTASLMKFCYCSVGIFLGLLIPDAYKTPAIVCALGVFAITYLPLMADFVKFMKNDFRSGENK